MLNTVNYFDTQIPYNAKYKYRYNNIMWLIHNHYIIYEALKSGTCSY